MNPETLLAMPGSYLLRDLVVLPFSLIAVWFLNTKVLNAQYCYQVAVCTKLAKQFAVGLAIGTIALIVTVLPGLLFGAFSSSGAGFRPFNPALDLTGVTSFNFLVNLFFFQALFEEMLFRALGLGLLGALLFWLSSMLGLGLGSQGKVANSRARLWVYCGTAANITVSCAFAFAHRGNDFASGIGIGNVMLAGLVIGQLFVLHRSISSAWGFHFAWNFMLALLGLPVSGFAIVSPVVLGFTGAVPGVLTGGAFGPEGSLPASVVLAIAFALLIKHSWTQSKNPPKPSATTEPKPLT